MKKRKIPYAALGFALLLVLCVSAIVRSVTAGPPTIPQDKDVAKAQRTAVPKQGTDERVTLPQGDLVAGNGIVEPADRETRVAGLVGGRIESILVREGQVVEKGAVLAIIEGKPDVAALAAAEAELEQAKADLARTVRGLRKEDVDAIVADTAAQRARAELSTQQLARVTELAKGGAATAEELDKARQQADADRSALEAAEARRRAALTGSRAEDVLSARARLAAAQARRDQAAAIVEGKQVRAPIAGEILSVRYRAGEYYSVVQNVDALIVMGDTSKLRVRMDVDERDIGRVREGQTAFATLNAYPGKRFYGKVVEIGKRMGRKNVRSDDPTERIDTKILEVVIELDEKQGLVPGLRVTSYVQTG
jgi:ABC exporter DevB family membrane fusion protein